MPEYRVGMMTNVSRVLMLSPPMTVMAKGAPKPDTNSPCPIAKGNMAMMVVMAVMRMGRTREMPATISARGLR